MISQEVHFVEKEKWHWEGKKGTLVVVSPPFIALPLVEDKTIDDLLVRGTRSSSDVYQRCNLFIGEPENLTKVATNPKWIDVM